MKGTGLDRTSWPEPTFDQLREAAACAYARLDNSDALRRAISHGPVVQGEGDPCAGGLCRNGLRLALGTSFVLLETRCAAGVF